VEFQELWEKLLTHFGLTEVPSSQHTWFRFTGEGTTSSSSRLDRFYIPSALLASPLFSPRVSSIYHQALYSPPPSSSGFTDHLPTSLSFYDTSTVHTPDRTQRIPQWIAEDSSFTT
jgi:hypothetical protein